MRTLYAMRRDIFDVTGVVDRPELIFSLEHPDLMHLFTPQPYGVFHRRFWGCRGDYGDPQRLVQLVCCSDAAQLGSMMATDLKAWLEIPESGSLFFDHSRVRFDLPRGIEDAVSRFYYPRKGQTLMAVYKELRSDEERTIRGIVRARVPAEIARRHGF